MAVLEIHEARLLGRDAQRFPRGLKPYEHSHFSAYRSAMVDMKLMVSLLTCRSVLPVSHVRVK